MRQPAVGRDGEIGDAPTGPGGCAIPQAIIAWRGAPIHTNKETVVINVHFHNMESQDFFIQVRDLNSPNPAQSTFNARLNGGQDFTTPLLYTDGRGYGRVGWTLTNPTTGAATQGEQADLTQGQQIDIYG